MKLPFKKKKKEEIYVLKPEEYDLPSLMKQIKKTIREEMANLKAENILLREKLQKYEKKKKIDDDIKKLKEEVIKKQRTIKQAESSKKIWLKIDVKNRRRLPVFLRRSRKTFGKFVRLYGFEIYEDDETGEIVFYPLVTDGKRVKKVPASFFDLRDLFREKVNIVSQLRSGFCHSNVEVIDDKIIIVPTITKEKGKQKGIDKLSDVDRQYYETIIGKLKHQNEVLSTELIDAERREALLLEELNDVKHSLDIEIATNSYLQGLTSMVISKLKEIIKEHGALLIANQDSEINRLLSTRMNHNFSNVIEELQDKLTSYMSSTNTELVKEELIENVRDVLDIVKETKQELGKKE